ncbi:phosphatase 2C-like domain-containing protein [Phyllosticta capitalensis]|uniref:phosphatase 2C-like domain-containing protein n=1 Tax=Phyllosticta capitalensis TaxID=121624 RepID=UPI0031317CD0
MPTWSWRIPHHRAHHYLPRSQQHASTASKLRIPHHRTQPPLQPQRLIAPFAAPRVSSLSDRPFIASPFEYRRPWASPTTSIALRALLRFFTWTPRRPVPQSRSRPQLAQGTTTPAPDESRLIRSASPFYFEAGYALYAKRASRPFPPPFLSYPSGSFSDPLSTHNRSRDTVNGEMIRGITNGDDAVLVSDNFIGANDGVGAWAAKERGHAALWSRLILHFWALEAERDLYGGENKEPDPVEYLHRAFEATKDATSAPNEWYGTTTACGALLGSDVGGDATKVKRPVLWVTQLGDSQVLVLRPRTREVIFKTKEQWHWFDCPRQLGTNSPDSPRENAVLDRVEIEEDDVVLAMSDGVVDNLWEHEVVQSVLDSMAKWENGDARLLRGIEPGDQCYADAMQFVAEELVKAARNVAEDPFAESPYMEKAVDEGLSIEGGKLDDISVVAAQCKRRKV